MNKQPEAGFYYIPQDNYYIANLDKPNAANPEKYLYSDSATSCIIIIVTGKNAAGESIVVLSHLSKPACFEAFFQLIADHFRGEVCVFAQGGNSPATFASDKDEQAQEFPVLDDALRNLHIFNKWHVPNTFPQKQETWYITRAALWLGTGNPLESNRDCFGIDLATMQVSNQRFELTETGRDVTGGLQVLFSIFGSDLNPPIAFRVSNTPFTQAQIKQLIAIAYSYHWLEILDMDCTDILHYFSTTPQCEVPWFCQTLRQSAQYVKDHLYLLE